MKLQGICGMGAFPAGCDGFGFVAGSGGVSGILEWE